MNIQGGQPDPNAGQEAAGPQWARPGSAPQLLRARFLSEDQELYQTMQGDGLSVL